MLQQFLKTALSVVRTNRDTCNAECVRAALVAAAEKYKVGAELLAAIALQESGGNPFATRYEPGFFRRYILELKPEELTGTVSRRASLDTEKHGRATSWGLLQVMGETARAHGFSGDFFTELCDPDAGAQIGAKYLAHVLKLDAKADPRKSAEARFFSAFLGSYDFAAESLEVTRIKLSLLRWNGGGNLRYPHEVWSRVQNGTAAKFLKGQRV